MVIKMRFHVRSIALKIKSRVLSNTSKNEMSCPLYVANLTAVLFDDVLFYCLKRPGDPISFFGNWVPKTLAIRNTSITRVL